jgi:hypothetical protein
LYGKTAGFGQLAAGNSIIPHADIFINALKFKLNKFSGYYAFIAIWF